MPKEEKQAIKSTVKDNERTNKTFIRSFKSPHFLIHFINDEVT